MCAVQSSRRKAWSLVAQGTDQVDSGGRSRFHACEVGDVGVLEATELEVSRVLVNHDDNVIQLVPLLRHQRLPVRVEFWK